MIYCGNIEQDVGDGRHGQTDGIWSTGVYLTTKSLYMIKGNSDYLTKAEEICRGCWDCNKRDLFSHGRYDGAIHSLRAE